MKTKKELRVPCGGCGGSMRWEDERDVQCVTCRLKAGEKIRGEALPHNLRYQFNPIWQCDAFHKTAEQAVEEFLMSEYWVSCSRKIDGRITKEGDFFIKGGRRRYNVRFVDNIPPVYQISVEVALDA